MTASSALQNRMVNAETPAMINVHAIAKELGTTYHTVMSRLLCGGIQPDAIVNFRPLFRAERIEEIKKAIEQ